MRSTQVDGTFHLLHRHRLVGVACGHGQPHSHAAGSGWNVVQGYLVGEEKSAGVEEIRQAVRAGGANGSTSVHNIIRAIRVFIVFFRTLRAAKGAALNNDGAI